MATSKSSRPESRGLVWATVIFSVFVLGGFAWMSRVGTGNLYERSEQTVRSWFSEPDAWVRRVDTLAYEDKVTTGHAKVGAIVGVPEFVTPDTVVVSGQRFRLWGVRAVPGVRFCGDAPPNGFECGVTTETAIPTLIRGFRIACYDRGESTYGERLGQCYFMNLDLSGQLASHGLARAITAESSQYGLREAFARSRRNGIWAQ